MAHFHIDPDISKAETLDTAYYTDPECLKISKEKIFARSWQLVGDADMLAEHGSVHPVTLLEGYMNEPLLLTKDKDGNLHCLSNVCTHRGNILADKPCQLDHLRCRYHGRLFGLDGTFRSMPEFKEVQNFPTERDNLHKLSLHQWGKLLFTSLDNTIRPEDFLGEMMERMSWYPVQNLQYSAERSKDYTVYANWALYCENYLEGFHIPFVHPTLNHALDFGEYTTELFRYSNLQLGIGKKREECFSPPATSPDHGKNISAYYFWVFPNMMFNFYPWGLSVNIVKPISESECKVSFLTYMLDESMLNVGAGAGLESVEMEDEEVVMQVQKGIRSRFYTHGRYSVTREQGTHHFHSLIAEFMNA